MDIERLVVRLVADASQYNRAMDGVEHRLISLANIAGPIGRMLDVPIIAATAAVTALGVASAIAAYEAIKLATSYEQSAIALEVMTGSAKKAKDLLDDITKYAIESPFRTPALLTGAQSLLAFGIEADNVMNTLKVLGEVSAGVGMDKLPRLILAFGQVRVAGRLMGPELRQFIDAGVPMIDYLAKVLGKPRTAIKGMVEEAKVSANDVSKAFNLMVKEGELFHNMTARQFKGVAGQWSALVETFEVSLRNIGLAFFAEFKVAENLGKLTDMIGSTNKDEVAAKMVKIHEIVKMIERGIRATVYWIQKAWDETNKWFKENEEILKKIGNITAQILLIVGVVTSIVIAFSALSTILGALISPLGLLIAGVTAFVLVMNELGDMKGFGDAFVAGFQKAFDVIKTLGPALKDALVGEDWDLAGKIVFKGLEIGLKTFVATMKQELLGMVAVLGARIETEFERLRKYAEAFGEGVKGLFTGANVEENSKKFNARIQEINKEAEASQIDKIKRINQIQIDNVNKAIEPYRKQAEELAKQARDARRAKEDPYGVGIEKIMDQNKAMVELTDEWMQSYHKFVRDFTGKNLSPQEIENKVATDEFLRKAVDEWQRKTHTELLNEIFNKFGVAGLERQIKMVGAQPGDDYDKFVHQFATLRTMMSAIPELMMVGFSKVAGEQNVQGPAQMKVPKAISAEALDYANRIQKEMERGIWGGQRQSHFDFFQKQLGLAQEAFRGPEEFDINNMFRKTGVLSKQQRDFAWFEEFSNLQKAVGRRTDRLPQAMFRGTAEAQDVVNRATTENKSVEEQIRDTIMQAKVIQEEQRDYQKKTVEVLEKLIKEGIIKTGGF